jgi:hypothetical protein
VIQLVCAGPPNYSFFNQPFLYCLTICAEVHDMVSTDPHPPSAMVSLWGVDGIQAHVPQDLLFSRSAGSLVCPGGQMLSCNHKCNFIFYDIESLCSKKPSIILLVY